MAAAPIPWRPLGMLLVARGVLTHEQLEAALDEQLTTGRRLGEILVERGVIRHSTLSLVLAEQYGIHPSVESGFGTGLRVLLAGRPELERQHEAAAPVVELELEAPDDSPVTHLEERLEEQWATLAAVQERLAATELELERRRAQARRLLTRIRSQQSPRTQLGERLAVTEQQLERRRAQALRLVTRLRSQPAPGDDGSEGHVVFVQLGEGYELLERDGGPPACDARFELEGFPDAVFVVTTVGRSPLPNDRRSCAFAQRAFD